MALSPYAVGEPVQLEPVTSRREAAIVERVTRWRDPIADARRAGWALPFSQRLLRIERAGVVRWLTPAQAGISQAVIEAIERAEAEGDRRHDANGGIA